MDINRERELRKHRCCFTGHRPDKLNISKETAVIKLRMAVYSAFQNGYTTFITGMAPGIDVWAAEVVYELKRTHPSVKLIAAVPYPKFGKTRDYRVNLEYKRVLEKADYIKTISNYYYDGVFQKRNEWMVDHSNMVIAVCHKKDGEIIQSGTKNTVDYALKENIEVKMIEV